MGNEMYKPSAIAAVVILFVVAVWVRAHFFVRGTSGGAALRHRRLLNSTVDFVPLSGVHVQQANHDREAAQAHQAQAHHHLRPVDSVASLRHPPPAYPAHHLDTRYDSVAYGYDNIGNLVRSVVDVLLGPLPPSYTTNSGEDHPPL